MTASPARRHSAAVIRGLTATTVLLWASILPEGGGSSAAAAVSPVALREILERRDGLRVEGQPLDTRALRRFYRPRGFTPVWDMDHGGEERASQLLEALAGADVHGLDPRDYHLDAIRARTLPGDRDAIERELLLTDAFLRYATHVRAGRLHREGVEPDWGIAPAPFDAVAALAKALREPPTLFPAFLRSLPPPAEGYAGLVEALRRYRAIAARGGWSALPPGPLLRRGDSDARIPALRGRLAAEDDLAPRVSGPDYDDALEEGVRRFQARQGLVVDGIVGPETLRALNVPVADRIRQIGLNLERWRWLPRDLGRRYIAVNVADAILEVVVNGRTALVSRVVVGDLKHPTPAVQARLDGIIFNPPWNVPASIVVEEVLPRLLQNPHYLADNEIVIVDRRESDPFGLAIDWSTVPSDPFPFRLQQRPGGRNPLGRIKFDTPNPFDVYLHDTPGQSLFARPVRTASHGCIRVERARDLAAHILASQAPPWTVEMIDGAIATGNMQRVPVARPLPLYVVYWTALVGANGAVHFRDDVYGRDRRLVAALAGGGNAGVVGSRPERGAVGCPAVGEEARR